MEKRSAKFALDEDMRVRVCEKSRRKYGSRWCAGLFSVGLVLQALYGKSPEIALAAQDEVAKPRRQIVAEVNGQALYFDEVQSFSERVFAELLRTELSAAELHTVQKLALEKLIEQQLLSQAARKFQNKEKKPQTVGELASFRQQFSSDIQFEEWLIRLRMSEAQVVERLAEQAIIKDYLQKQVYSKIRLNKKQLRRYYEGHVSEFYRPSEYRLRHFLVSLPEHLSPEEEKAYLQQAEANFRDRSAVREELPFVSIEQRAVALQGQGSDLGYLTKNQLPPEIAEVLVSLPVGEVSPGQRQGKSQHYFKLEDVRPRRLRSFAEVEKQIRSNLEERQKRNLLQAHLGMLRQTNRVIVYLR